MGNDNTCQKGLPTKTLVGSLLESSTMSTSKEPLLTDAMQLGDETGQNQGDHQTEWTKPMDLKDTETNIVAHQAKISPNPTTPTTQSQSSSKLRSIMLSPCLSKTRPMKKWKRLACQLGHTKE